MKKPELYLINGPLGAGKTTLLRYLLAQDRFKNARVIENEFASTSVDSALLDTHSAAVQTIAGLCICCTSGDELTEALDAFAQSDEPVIIEATGVANTLKLVEALVLGGSVERYHLAASLFVLDAAELDETILATYRPELVAADIVAVSKLDIVDDPEQVLARVRRVGATQVTPLDHGKLPLALLDQDSSILDFFVQYTDELRTHDALGYSVVDAGLVDIRRLELQWQHLVEQYGLKRMKGDNGRQHIEATPRQFLTSRVNGAATGRLVFIGERAAALTVPVLLQELADSVG